MAVNVHPTAIIEAGAWLDDEVEIGPYCLVSAGAVIGRGTKLFNNVTLRGLVRIGCDNVLHPNCVIGGEPQDVGYRGDPTWVVIGDQNVFREACTIHRATTKELGVTTVGSNNYLMGGVHVGHDGCLGNYIVIANNTLLSGHVHVQDYAALSGNIGVHQFVTIGRNTFIGALTRLSTDAPPYMIVEGHPSHVRCINLVGLKRRGFDAHAIRSIAAAHRLLYRMHTNAAQAKAELKRTQQYCEPVAHLFDFLENQHAGRRGRGREGLRAA